MLTILDLLNHYLGFFNVNTRWKGRVYTILATVGNFYILYLAIKHLQNGAYLRGVVLVLAFFGILYLALLNIFYYFTQKTFKWDVSPMIEKRLGTQEQKDTGAQRLYVPANGLYAQQDVLPTTVTTDDDMQAELTVVAEQLLANHLMAQDFGGLTENEQLDRLATQEVVYANEPGTPLPYFRLENERGGLAVYGGVNEMMAKRLGRIRTVGLMPVADALKQYDLFIATAVISGGLGHVRGRAGLTTVTNDYHVRVEVAYKAKTTN